MAFDAFLKINGIPGEALDEQHRDWIEITGYRFGTQQGTSATASSAGALLPGVPPFPILRLPKPWINPVANSWKPVAQVNI